MSDSNVENTSSESNQNGETSSSDNKPSLTSLTHKLKAEALRRFKLDHEVDNEAEDRSSTQDAKVDSNKLKGQGLNNQSQLDSVKQGEAIGPNGNQESASLSVSDTLNSVNQKELSSLTVEQNIDVANLKQSNEAYEQRNITSEKIEDSEANRSPNESLQISDSINKQESSDDHIVDSPNYTVPESSVPNENTSYPTGLAQDKYQSVEGNRNADTSTEVKDQKAQYSDKNEHLTQPSGDSDHLQGNDNRTSYDNGSELIDSLSEMQLQSDNAAFSDQALNTMQVSDADEIMPPLNMGGGSGKFEDLIRNDHSAEISNNKTSVKEALASEKIIDSKTTHEQNAFSNELQTNTESNIENNFTRSTKNEVNDASEGLEQHITSTSGNIDAGSFKGEQKMYFWCQLKRGQMSCPCWFEIGHMFIFFLTYCALNNPVLTH
jgi:hypothetical protein